MLGRASALHRFFTGLFPVRLIVVCAAVLHMFLTCCAAYSFDFFWTDEYKAKHPKPANNMPKTMDEYYREVNKAADKSKEIPSPKFEQDEKLVELPDPSILVVKYNDPPGKVEINLNDLKKKRKINSIGVASPQFDRLVYSTVYYYPSTKTAGSELYLMRLDKSKSVQNRMEEAHVNHGRKILYRTEMDSLDLDIQKTLTVVDWSADGKRLAFKEKISYTPDGLWKTNLFVYDFETGKVKELSEVRDAILYYWRANYDIRFKDFRWDIYPVGWDARHPDRIIVFAYAATGENPKFLGAWSVDYKGNRAMLLSPVSTQFDVTQNGSCLKSNYNN